MNMIADKPKPNVADIRERLLAHKAATNSSWSMLAAPIGVPHGTLSVFGGGNYIGDNEKIAAKVAQFLDTLEEQASIPFELPEAPDFQLTPSAQRILSQLRWAQRGKIVAITAAPGIGKTTALHRHQAEANNVWIPTMSPACSGVQPMQLRVLHAMGARDVTGSPQQLSLQILDRVQRSRGLIAFDEAQNLSEKALDEIRSWHDACGIGIALVGSDDVILRLAAGSRARKLAQLTSRISMRMMQAEALSGDADMIARAWGVENPQQLAFLAQVASKPGAVRNVAKTVELAFVLAEGTGLTLGLLRDAWAQLSSHTTGGC